MPSPWSGGDVRGEVAAGADHTPAPECLGELERRAADRLGHGTGGALRLAAHRQVHVADRAAEQGVAHAAAHDPRLVHHSARQRVAHGAHGRLGGQAVVERAQRAPSHCRRTRGLSPHVIS